MQTLYRFLKDETGATAIEYGLIAALVSVVIITAVATLGTNLTHDVRLHQRRARDRRSLLIITGADRLPARRTIAFRGAELVNFKDTFF